jgi:hypothetical protein
MTYFQSLHRIYFSKRITNLRLIISINCVVKLSEKHRQNKLLHTKLQNRPLSTRHVSLVFSTDMTNLTAQNSEPFDEYICQ